jgi:predicted alpha/beta hydrolase family esterase
MKQQILFIQGGGAGAHKADELLVAALRSALGLAYNLRYPMMPSESDPDYERWRTSIGKELAALADGPIIIGHSLGASFLLKYLSEEKVGKTIAGLFLIAPPYWGGRGWRYEGYERVALCEEFGAKLPRGTPVFLYHSRDDEIVPFAHLALYAEKLPETTVRELDGRGHQLNNDLSEVVADIKKTRLSRPSA